MGKYTTRIPEATRDAVIIRSRMCCEDCKVNKAEHMHHLTYARAGNELPEDLQHLCTVCHGKRHPNHNFRTAWEQQQIKIWRKGGKGTYRMYADLLARVAKLEQEVKCLKSAK